MFCRVLAVLWLLLVAACGGTTSSTLNTPNDMPPTSTAEVSDEAPLKRLPKTEDTLVVRTDFTDDAAWNALCATIQAPVRGFRAYVHCLSDPEYDGRTAEQLRAAAGDRDTLNHTFIFIVDRVALTHPDHPILVVDFYDEPGRTFRVIPAEMASVENNLSIANMDFADFADYVGPDGIFRGLP